MAFEEEDAGEWRRAAVQAGLDALLSGASLNDATAAVDAIVAGRDEIRDREVERIVHNLDGTIGERNTYGHDPRSIPG